MEFAMDFFNRRFVVAVDAGKKKKRKADKSHDLHLSTMRTQLENITKILEESREALFFYATKPN